MRPLLPAVLAVLAVAAPALANDTAMHMGSSGPEPVGGGLTGAESVVRMVKERLDVTFGRKATRMTARFTFRNTLPKATATQIVGFPDEGAAQAERDRRGADGGGSDTVGPLRELATLVDGQVRKAPITYGYVQPAPNDAPGWVKGDAKTGSLMAWHALTVQFPPGRDVVVERRFATDNGTNVLGVNFFEYVTHTGGPWKGKIGELVATVTLVDGLTVDKLLWPGAPLDPQAGGGTLPPQEATRPARSAWKVLAPNRMQLVWRDFEPRAERARSEFALVVKR